MRVAIYSSKKYDREHLQAAFGDRHSANFFDVPLSLASAELARDHRAICAFVNDDLSSRVLEALAHAGVQLVALRCTGFNNVDLKAARRLGLRVARVPEYSPHAVAEHTIGLILALNRKLHRAYNRVREGNFSLDGLKGFDLCSRTVGIVGTGRIGSVVATILTGFGCSVLATDTYPNATCTALGVQYVSWEDLCLRSDILTLHCPLTPETYHLVDHDALDRMKPGVMLVNTSRGAVIDTRAVIDGLKSGHVGHLGLDVYEEEAHLFFEDLSDRIIDDDVFARLLTFPNVLITGHQGFFTHEALSNIAHTTCENLSAFESTGRPLHEISVEVIAAPVSNPTSNSDRPIRTD